MSVPAEKMALFIDGANLYATAKSLGFDIDYEHAGSPELPSSPASQEPSRPVTASQSRASFAWRLRLFDHFACVGERCLPIAIRSFRGFHPAPVSCGPHSVSAKKSRISM